MRNGTISSQIQIPPVVLLGKLQSIYLSFKNFKPLLSLRPTNNFSDLRSQDVESSNCLAILVVSHVEGLDMPGIVIQNNWSMEDMLTQISLVLGSQIHAPFDLVLVLGEYHASFLDLSKMTITCSRI